MTKTYNLTRLDYGWYGLPRKAICHEFVSMIIGRTPAKVKVVVSTDPIKDAMPIGVTKGGYYRWKWRRLDKDCPMHGMTLAAEDELNSIFPKAVEDGRDVEKNLWISLTIAQAYLNIRYE